MDDEDLLICHHLLTGFCLTSKRWGYFDIETIQELSFSSDAFDHLTISQRYKDMIRSLVTQHNTQDSLDDLVSGKGKGLCFLLHGPPGVGKTFTAEGIADLTGRPLYRMDSSRIFSPRSLNADEVLIDCFSLVKRWGAVLLLDEADVAMQQRDLDSLDRNNVVSSLLKHIEYFEGIMFLTTNRLESIDSAFLSRIHVPILYPPLSVEFKQQLWNTGLARANAGKTPAWATKRLLTQLAKAEVNGREIKNVIKVASTLADSAKRDMKSSDVFQGLAVFEKFNKDFMDARDRGSSWTNQFSTPRSFLAKLLWPWR